MGTGMGAAAVFEYNPWNDRDLHWTSIHNTHSSRLHTSLLEILLCWYSLMYVILHV